MSEHYLQPVIIELWELGCTYGCKYGIMRLHCGLAIKRPSGEKPWPRVGLFVLKYTGMFEMLD